MVQGSPGSTYDPGVEGHLDRHGQTKPHEIQMTIQPPTETIL